MKLASMFIIVSVVMSITGCIESDADDNAVCGPGLEPDYQCYDIPGISEKCVQVGCKNSTK